MAEIDKRLINITDLVEYTTLIQKYIQDHTSDATLYNTCEYWNAQKDLIPKAKQLIVYIDAVSYQGMSYPMVKFGDGNAYLQDLPFVNEATLKCLYDHINDKVVHITEEERIKWNSAVKASVSSDESTLILKFVGQ